MDLLKRYIQCVVGVFIYSHLIFLQYCSDCVLQAIQDSNGMDMLTALVESGANINLPFSNGAYPLHEAVVSRKHDTVLFLLNKGANIKQKMSVSSGRYLSLFEGGLELCKSHRKMDVLSLMACVLYVCI